MGITRRSLLQLMAGASAGVMVTPLPWKLLDDVSIWTQTWFLTPKLTRSETSTAFGACGLCSGGCGLRIRLLGDTPIAVTGEDGHPVSHGGVCPLGMGGPQLRYHPLRIVKPVMRDRDGALSPTTPKQAVARISNTLAACRKNPDAGSLAILDWRPGSAMSGLYDHLIAQAGGGVRIAPPTVGQATDRAVREMVASGPEHVGYDFENARTVLCLGTPLFEAWASLGRMAGINRMWQRTGKSGRPSLIVADPNHTTTAAMADTWLPITPGSEAALALGIGHVLIKENIVKEEMAGAIPDLAGYQRLVSGFDPQKVAALTGLTPGEIRSTALTLKQHAPAIVVGGGSAGAGPLGLEEEIAIFGLNFLLGSYGVPGGVVPFGPMTAEPAQPVEPSEQPEPAQQPEPDRPFSTSKPLAEVADGSVRLLIIDSALPESAMPWRLLKDKLAANGLAVSFNPYLAGANLEADIVLPTAVAGEWEFDLPTAPGGATAAYGLSAKLVDPPPGLVSPPDLLAIIAKTAGFDLKPNLHGLGIEKALGSILAAGRGSVFDPKSARTKPITGFRNATALHKALAKGGTWVDGAKPTIQGEQFFLLGRAPGTADRLAMAGMGRLPRLRGEVTAYPLVLMPFGHCGESGGGAVPQVLTKIYRETGLRSLYLDAHINPETGADQHLTDSCQAELTTPTGTMTVRVIFDRSVMPKVVRVAAGPTPLSLGDVAHGTYPSILDIAEITDGEVWRLTRASLKEVGHV
ncbi:MAG: molybdopterin-dependent oxidoreductase [Myxococcota bacterium]|nr:molybdopterin-dependent oxidoreductase [Myxococcota bacterium]